MQNRKIYEARIEQFLRRVAELRYPHTAPLAAQFTYDAELPILIAELDRRLWKPIQVGEVWGETWGSAWFRLTATVPPRFAGEEVLALVDVSGEAAVFRDGEPVQGLTDSGVTAGGMSRQSKRRVPLFARAEGGEHVELLIEAAANRLFGATGESVYSLRQAELVVFDRDSWQLSLDLEFLLGLAKALPGDSARGQKLLAGLNRAANAWSDGGGREEVRRIIAALKESRADASAPTCWSVGHAHLDLGWLWPVRETRRKAGRTFSTALRLIEEYPQYVFGASQPQAYEWVKTDYPRLYDRIKQAVADGRWELQGAMWVEADMNVPSGESLVRQCLFGMRFFRDEFGKAPDHLWLPDVFGYSAALPQILVKSGVSVFMTQKISWNETNSFPHHTFVWEGIDGTRILSHFLPSNNYNCSNSPEKLRSAMQNFKQVDVRDDFLNLYGIGDGGGGPSRAHIELAIRAADCEGLPKVKLAAASEFFDLMREAGEADLPKWVGELYLELHRATLTTQALAKRENRVLEQTLHDVEMLGVLAGSSDRAALEALWKDTLLHQFHDILPGSSISEVYEDLHAANANNLVTLARLREEALATLHGPAADAPSCYVVYNTLSWRRHVLALIPWNAATTPSFTDGDGNALIAQPTEHGYLVPLTVPSIGHTTTRISAAPDAEESTSRASSDTTAPDAVAPVGTAGTTGRIPQNPREIRWSSPTIIPVIGDEQTLENSILRVKIAANGTIVSIYDKEYNREALSGPANRLLLWEDYPYSWDAWDVSHYYRETSPEQATLVERELVENGPLRASISQTLQIGSSSIYQRVSLEAESRMVQVETQVDWKETHRFLRVQAEPAVHAETATYEIQFGVVRRPTHANTSWDQARFETVGHRFVDISQPDYGLALLNDGKYGHYIRDGIMDLALLRGATYPDPHADIGAHRFTFAYYPHPLAFEMTDVVERAHELNAACIPWPLADTPADTTLSHFEVSGGGVKLETIKHAEDDESVILRMYETRGARRRVSLRGRLRWARIEETNLLEESPVPLEPRLDGEAFASAIDLEFGPFEIRTFRVRHGRGA